MQLFDAQTFRPRVIAIFMTYRLCLAAILFLAYWFMRDTFLLPSSFDPLQFYVLLGVYVIVIFLSWAAMWGIKQEQYSSTAVLLLDVLLLNGLAYVAGGPTTGLHTLVLVPIALAGILLPTKSAFFIAAVSTSVLVYSTFLIDIANAPQVAVLGVIEFATVALVSYLRVRLTRSEQLAKAQELDIRELQILNQQVIDRLRTPIIVVTRKGLIKLQNQSAQAICLLSTNQRLAGALLSALDKWLVSGKQPEAELAVNDEFPSVTVSFRALTDDSASDIMIFMEDARSVAQQAQQLKLASLGRLTASIAHEIRNPLSAIRHAEQLLAEAEYLSDPDRQLLNMIERNCQRVDGIINNVLQLGRRQSVNSERFDLGPVMQSVIEDYRSRFAQVSFEVIKPEQLDIRFDQSQLLQLLNNLLDNAVRHASEPKTVQLQAGVVEATQQPYLDIIDSGEGPNDEVRKQLFEPFFTTESKGTGLGLYICRELAISNQAELSCIADGQGHFRVLFSHPDRR
ncbi:ATP-binding protein [Salinibius halmophilus]|uniref:ATP-binding protein n=1 Tax=Salinibius halmophilus TaxID=1853216 RepID=UPI000E6606F3|nr:HAMP domain-containing sensor histidine kinase [Salinibius halmophilus]